MNHLENEGGVTSLHPTTRYLSKHKYSKCTVEGDKKTKWICGCFQTADDYFKFCDRHNNTLRRAIQAQIDELDMTQVIDEKG